MKSYYAQSDHLQLYEIDFKFTNAPALLRTQETCSDHDSDVKAFSLSEDEENDLDPTNSVTAQL